MGAWQDYRYEATLTRIYDGDTVFVSVDLGFRIAIWPEIGIRLYGINAPELSTPEGKTALAYIQTLLLGETRLYVQSYKDPSDKYGRWLADVYRASDSLWINQAMIDAGHAVVYKP